MKLKSALEPIVAIAAIALIAGDASAYYASHLGRWLTRDPIGYAGNTMNLYEFVHSQPGNNLDPGGLAMSQPRPPSKPGNGKGCPGCNGRGPTQCCNGTKYDSGTQCCEDGNVVNKVSIWICERPLLMTGGTILHNSPHNILTPGCIDTQHSYVCCNGPNRYCFGKQNTCMKGDPIGREVESFGEQHGCFEKKVCPKVKKSKCENPVANEDYGWCMPGYENCHDWAWDGVD